MPLRKRHLPLSHHRRKMHRCGTSQRQSRVDCIVPQDISAQSPYRHRWKNPVQADRWSSQRRASSRTPDVRESCSPTDGIFSVLRTRDRNRLNAGGCKAALSHVRRTKENGRDYAISDSADCAASIASTVRRQQGPCPSAYPDVRILLFELRPWQACESC